MNNIKKIGLTALAGSLVMVSAQAIEYTMSGGLASTYTTQKAPTTLQASEGKGIGTASDLAFNASGELDNGFTVDYFMAVDTNAALTNTSSFMTVGMGSLGTLRVNNIGGSSLNAIDDMTPNAYVGTWDGVAPTNLSWFGNATNAGSISYNMPAQELAGININASYTYDPAASTAAPAKGAVNALNPGSGSGYTAQLSHESGLEIGGGVENISTSGATNQSDESRTTGYVKFATGGLTVAYQEAYQDSYSSSSSLGLDKEVKFFGAAYTMGDLTVSYATAEQDTHKGSGLAGADGADKLANEKQESIQAAYVMGAMTISAAMSETDNVAGVLADKYEENTLAISFAF